MISVSFLFEGLFRKLYNFQHKHDEEEIVAGQAAGRLIRRVIPNKVSDNYDKAVEVGRDIKTTLGGK